MDKLSFLDSPEGEGVVAPVEPVEPVQDAVEAPQPVEQPQVVEAQVEQPASPLEVPVIDHKPEPGFVPLAAVLEERDKRKAMEAELARYRQQQQPEPVEVPDPIDDPDGFSEFQQQYVQQTALNIKLDFSEDMARTAHGDETVDAAKAWALERFGNNPAYQAEVLRDRNPYGRAVKDYLAEQRVQKLSGMPDDEFAQFQAWKAAQAQIQPATTPAATPVSPAPIPAPSIASAPSAGGVTHTPVGAGVAFDAMFKN